MLWNNALTEPTVKHFSPISRNWCIRQEYALLSIEGPVYQLTHANKQACDISLIRSWQVRRTPNRCATTPTISFEMALLLLHPWEGCEVLRWACLSVRQLAYLKHHTSKLHEIFRMTRRRGSVLFWQQCNMSCTFGIVVVCDYRPTYHPSRRRMNSSTAVDVEALHIGRFHSACGGRVHSPLRGGDGGEVGYRRLLSLHSTGL